MRSERTCTNCRAWVAETTESPTGECRVWPPLVYWDATAGSLKTAWPTTASSGACEVWREYGINDEVNPEPEE